MKLSTITKFLIFLSASPLILASCQELAYTSSDSDNIQYYYTKLPRTTEWTVENVYKAILTESAGEGEKGMEYVASCLWNRYRAGLNLGCSGLLRNDLQSFVEHQPQRVREIAVHLSNRVLYGADNFDIVGGATRFESIDFPAPECTRNSSCIEVFRYRKHVFYKEVTERWAK